MENLLNRLYEALGLDAPEDEPLLIVDDEIQVYFNESDLTLEMCCPFMPVPDDILTLQHFLRLNYTSSVTIGADADNTALVALYRLPQTCTEEEAIAGFELLISKVKQFKEHYT
ncbi:type III secretion system chaperone [Salmonella enterica subsp. salamae]|uniref:Type III secretion chaperone protein SigE n=3 Tax=Salmonella enterica TaxID=28901 RepID=A0A379QKT8_SALER|nr:type III secretion system chaperone [Salmonella enterica]ECC1482432.1 type III secretion system chaperone [Salmonella enterica subsp. salamae]EHM1748921.1 type III secretion system chaperone [Salmonella enterica subsp. salamae serovar 40:c:e,n,x,z15]HCM1997464.1 type III secretion system chaperone [Salmonella enterica subsp. salamae serovar [1],40:z35:e,n,x,z15]ASG87878.1 type III secretion chaperone protein SigE [Salmonella enterica subsp. salamae serovar 55:k:z39 str. 1315K]ECC1656762.1 t